MTLTNLQASRPRITLEGTLSANINLIVPAWQKSWFIDNKKNGAFSVTVKTASGTGVAVMAGAKALVYGNGTNITLDNQTQNISTQVTGIVGPSRNLTMSVTSASASASATVTADEIIVGTALGGSQYRIGSFNKAINLGTTGTTGTTGAGGMDTGTAPANGFVAVYAIYNPVSGASALLGVNATSVKAPEVYSGANMPSGYTASALLSVAPVHTTVGQFAVFIQYGREVYFSQRSVLNTTAVIGTITALSIASAVPLNANLVRLSMSATQTVNGNGVSLVIAGSTTSIGNIGVGATTTAGSSSSSTLAADVPVITPQTIYYNTSSSSGGSFSALVRGYRF